MGMGKGMGGSRFGDRGGREGGSRFNDRGGREGCGPRLGGRMGSRNEGEAPTSATANRSLWEQSYRTTFIKPNLPSHLQPKKKEEPVLPAVEAPLALLPGEDEEAARARIEKRKLEEEEAKLAAEKSVEEADNTPAKHSEESVMVEAAQKVGYVENDLLAVFASSGDKIEGDLKAWCLV
jgi:hypothetical protein